MPLLPVTIKFRLVVAALILLSSSFHCTKGDPEALLDLAEELSLNSGEGVVSSEDDTSSSSIDDPSHQDEEILYKTPDLDAESLPYFLYESFDDELNFNGKWIQSRAKKAESESEFVYDGEWALTPSHSRLKGDGSLLMKSRARHHAIGCKTRKVIEPSKERSVILQYEVQFRNGQECGGAYMKLLASPSGSLDMLNDKSGYSIMFGPDKCGNDYKLHFILHHRNPLNGTLREIHWKKAGSVNRLEEVVKDGRWHQLRLHLRNDNTFEIQLDKKVAGKGTLLTDFHPPINPPSEIPDETDVKPEDWDEREMIPDPDDFRPEDWDENEPRKIPDPLSVKPSDWDDSEPEMIPDPDSTKPDDWDPEMDGEWEPPLIANPKCSKVSGCGTWKPPLMDNPKYKGKWKPRMIKNVNFQGKWFPRKIPNPDFFEDTDPYMTLLPIDAVAFELWTISDSIAFDNVLVTNDVDVANYVVDHTFQLKKDLADEESDNMFVRLIKSTNKRPWLWAVYLLIIAVPVIAFIAYCCVEPVSKTSQESTDQQITARKTTDEQITARRKKTDEVTPDVSRSSPPKASKEPLVRESTPDVSRTSPTREEMAPDEEVEPEEEPMTEEEELVEEELVEEEVEGELVPTSGSGEEVAAEVEEVVQEPEEELEVEEEEPEPEPTSSKKGKARRRKKSAGRS